LNNNEILQIEKIIPILAAIIIIAAVWLVGFLQGSQWGWQMNLPSPFEKYSIKKHHQILAPEI